MGGKKLSKFTFIVNFRGGTYSSQVEATDIHKSILQWLKKIQKEQDQIKHLGDKIIGELKIETQKEYNTPVPLNGLKNIWYTSYITKKGSFHINIVKTIDD